LFESMPNLAADRLKKMRTAPTPMDEKINDANSIVFQQRRKSNSSMMFDVASFGMYSRTNSGCSHGLQQQKFRKQILQFDSHDASHATINVFFLNLSRPHRRFFQKESPHDHTSLKQLLDRLSKAEMMADSWSAAKCNTSALCRERTDIYIIMPTPN